jgi:hypothetical protein
VQKGSNNCPHIDLKMGWDVNTNKQQRVKSKITVAEKEEERTRNQNVQYVLGQNRQTLAADRWQLYKREHKKQCKEKHSNVI